MVGLPGCPAANYLGWYQTELGDCSCMSCNITRFYYCDPSIDLKSFLILDNRRRNGVAFDDIETKEANAFEEKLLQEGESYLRIDL
jgi:hypothetical protein